MSDDQLIVRRHLDAPPALVWEAFTTPEHLAAFWGGNHATVPVESVSVDVRAGGSFSLETIGPDGARPGTRLSFRYDVVSPPTLLVLSEARTGIVTEVRIEADGDGTSITVHQSRLPVELRTEQAANGLAGIVDRLTTVVKELQ